MEEEGLGRAAGERSLAVLGRSIGKTLERLRDMRGLTQEQVVERLRSGPGQVGMHPSGLSRLERGHRMPRANLLFLLCLSLEIDLPKFWQWEAAVRRELLGSLDDPGAATPP